MTFRPLPNLSSAEASNKYSDEFEVVISSYFNDQLLMKIQPVFETLEVEETIEKRQRTSSIDSQGINALKRSALNKQEAEPKEYNLVLQDNLATISPINNILQLPGNNLLVSSGHSTSSHYTIVKSGPKGLPAPLAVEFYRSLL